jgi:glycosyltransferase involved in cell wall biosynthesis
MARCSSGCSATTVPDERVRIGIWAVSDGSALWMADHVPRLVGGLVKGAASRGTMTFCICVSPSDQATARQMLLELAAREGTDWTLSEIGWDIRHSVALFNAWLLRRAPRLIRWTLFSMLLVLLPLRSLGALMRPLWRLWNQNGLSTVRNLFQDLCLAWHDPVATAAAIAPTLKRQRLGLARRLGKTLWSWTAALDANEGNAAALPLPPPANVPRRVRQANLRGLPETDGWLLLDPGQVTGLQLPGRRVTLVLSVIPFDFPFSLDAAEWRPGGRWDRWKRVACEMLETVDAVITASLDVVDRPVAGLFNISPAKLTTIPAATPDLWPLLRCHPADRVPTCESRHAAGCVLRQHALEHGWPYLIDFPFEDVPYIFVVAQDCPTQNVALVAEAVRLLLRREYFDIKLFTTACLELGESAGPVSRMVREAGLQFEVLSVPGLPPAAYAAFCHCAAMTVFPSYVAEDGLATTRFAESVSLGTPCLMAASPNSHKLFGHEPGLLPFLFDPYDAETLAHLIRQIAMDRPSALAAQSAILRRLPRHCWGDVAERYATIVSGRPIGAALQAGA